MEIFLDNAGRILIPAIIRRQLGLNNGDKVMVEIKDKKIIISVCKDEEENI